MFLARPRRKRSVKTMGRKKRKSSHDDQQVDARDNTMDLGPFDFDESCGGAEAPRSHQDLTWRHPDPEESLSDWTILVARDESDDSEQEDSTTTTYHVHKYVLGAGRHRSEYFKALFRSTNAELSEMRTSTSRVRLRPSAAAAFAQMLDHVYTGACDVSTDNVVALRSLSRYFGVRTLFHETKAFVQRDMNASNAHAYLLEAEAIRDDKLVAASKKMCVSHFGSLAKEQIRSLPLGLLRSILNDDGLDVDSEQLSLKVADYCRACPDELVREGDGLASITSSTVMPKIHPKEALFLLSLCLRNGTSSVQDGGEEGDDGDDGEEPSSSSMRTRCASVLREWRFVFAESVLAETNETTKKRRREGVALDDGRRRASTTTGKRDDRCGYSGLPSSIQVDLLEIALRFANDEVASLQTENELLRSMNSERAAKTRAKNERTLSKFDAQLERLRTENKELRKMKFEVLYDAYDGRTKRVLKKCKQAPAKGELERLEDSDHELSVPDYWKTTHDFVYPFPKRTNATKLGRADNPIRLSP